MPRSGADARNRAKASLVEVGVVGELERRHHLVTGPGVGHGVDRDHGDSRETGQDALDRGCGEVLGVDPQPVAGAPGEPEPAVLVAVGEVTGVVVTAAQLGLAGLGVAVVALEACRRTARDDLADRLVGVEQTAVLTEPRTRARLAPLVDEVDDEALRWQAESAGGSLRQPPDDAHPLRRAVGLDHRAPEAPLELLAVARRRFGAEAELQGVLSFGRRLRLGQDVGQRAPDVVEVGGLETLEVAQETGRREPAPGGERRTVEQRRRPGGHQRVAVEHRHRVVGHLLARQQQRRHLREEGEAARRADDRLGRTGRARGEEQQQRGGGVERGRADLLGRRSIARVGREQLVVLAAADDEDTRRAVETVEDDTVEEGSVCRLGDHDGAVGGPEVGGQLVTATRRVDADHCRATQGCAGDEEEVLGRVVHQHAHVPGPGVDRSPRRHQGRPHPRLGDDVAPRPLLVLEQQGRSVVLAATEQQLGGGGVLDGGQCHWSVMRGSPPLRPVPAMRQVPPRTAPPL